MLSQTLTELKVKGRVSTMSAWLVKQVPVGLKKGVELKMSPQQLFPDLEASVEP
jgi:hypothetical protein